MKEKGKQGRKVKLYTSISLILSLAIILIILKFTLDSTNINDLLQTKIQYEFFFAAILLNVFCWFIWGARLKILSNAIDKTVRIGWWESTKIVIANMFLAGITPSMAGGEPIRIYLLKKDGMSLGGATASVLGERLIDAIFIVACIPFALFILKDRIDIGLVRTGVLVGIIVFICAIIIFIYAIIKPKKTTSFLMFIEERLASLFKRKDKPERKKLVATIGREVQNFHNSMVFFVKDGRTAFFLGGVLTVAYWFVGFLIPSLLLMGLGLPPFFIESYAAQMLLLIIVMLPTTPGSSGVTELGMAGLYSVVVGSSFAVGSSLLFVFVLMFRFITYHLNLIAGAVFQYRVCQCITTFSLDALAKKDNEKTCP